MTQKVIVELFLGLALFMYGMVLMTQSMKSLSLDKIKTVMGKATSNRFKSFFVGLGVTSVIQSSSATSVLVIGLINVGVLTLYQAVPIIFGANIGTTITAQLISFNITDIAPYMIIGGLLINFIAKSQKRKSLGMSLFGFGLLFYGLTVMKHAVGPLKESTMISELFLQFGNHPFLGIMIGLIVTVVLQSSTTVIGLMIALASMGLLDLKPAFFLLLGDNIGTCITAILASLHSTRSGKRLAIAHTLFNIIGATIAIFMAPLYLKYIPMMSGDISRQIANTHTIFNILNALVFLPFVPLYVKFLNKIFPGDDYVKREIKYLDKNLMDTPSLAINSAVQEMVVMAQICKDMLVKVRGFIGKFDYKKFDEIETDESSVDSLQNNITNYLAAVTRKELSEKEALLLPNLFHSVNDLERVGDHVENIAHILRRKHESRIDLSTDGQKMLDELFENVDHMLDLTIKSMKDDDHDAACESIKVEEKTNQLTKHARDVHIHWLRTGASTPEKSLLFNDTLLQLERIGDHLYNITQGVIHFGKR